jgi:hypothetical protein
VDHVDGDESNNTVLNLRSCTASQNGGNSKIPKNNTTGFKGVYRESRSSRNPWFASLRIDGKQVHIGMYPTAIAAAKAYDLAAISKFGEFAKLNFPTETP